MPARKAPTLPGPFRKARPLALARPQPPLVFVPALAEIAMHELKDAEARMGVGVIGSQRDGATQRGDRLLELAGMMQRRAEIGPGVGELWLQLDRAAMRYTRLVETPERVQRVAEIAVRQREIRCSRDRVAMRGGSAFVVLELV